MHYHWHIILAKDSSVISVKTIVLTILYLLSDFHLLIFCTVTTVGNNVLLLLHHNREPNLLDHCRTSTQQSCMIYGHRGVTHTIPWVTCCSISLSFGACYEIFPPPLFLFPETAARKISTLKSNPQTGKEHWQVQESALS